MHLPSDTALVIRPERPVSSIEPLVNTSFFIALYSGAWMVGLLRGGNGSANLLLLLGGIIVIILIALIGLTGRRARIPLAAHFDDSRQEVRLEYKKHIIIHESIVIPYTRLTVGLYGYRSRDGRLNILELYEHRRLLLHCRTGRHSWTQENIDALAAKAAAVGSLHPGMLYSSRQYILQLVAARNSTAEPHTIHSGTDTGGM